jgi:hypothetical protein|tara:strand:- start:7955 stop:8284 length:330 start_codon:yes stop_codon:yes gene_type:complete
MDEMPNNVFAVIVFSLSLTIYIVNRYRIKALSLKSKKYLSGYAVFNIGNIKDANIEPCEIGLSLCVSEGFTEAQFICELTKRAMLQAINKSPSVLPKFVTVELVSIECN